MTERGQASLELLAGLPLLLLAAAVCMQLLATGYAATIADGAAEAGSLASVAGQPVAPAVRDALPGWARSRVELERRGGSLTVRLEPPALLGALGRALEVSSSTWVRQAGDG